MVAAGTGERLWMKARCAAESVDVSLGVYFFHLQGKGTGRI